MRKEEQYLDPNTEEEKNALIKSGEFDEMIYDTFGQFFGKL